jgi:hypothetical protein
VDVQIVRRITRRRDWKLKRAVCWEMLDEMNEYCVAVGIGYHFEACGGDMMVLAIYGV